MPHAFRQLPDILILLVTFMLLSSQLKWFCHFVDIHCKLKSLFSPTDIQAL